MYPTAAEKCDLCQYRVKQSSLYCDLLWNTFLFSHVVTIILCLSGILIHMLKYSGADTSITKHDVYYFYKCN